MKRIILLCCFTLCFGKIYAQNNDADYVKQHYIKKEVYIPMRDGKKLFTSIYLPKDQAVKYPIMLSRTPFGVGPYGEDNYKRVLGQNMLFTKEGYIFVFQDVRGRYMSEGDFVDIRPLIDNKKPNESDENSDAYDTIDWLVKNLPNNNGRVGIVGTSYPGYYTSAALPNAHPALKAASPQAPVTDWFMGDDFHHNGAFFQMDGFGYFSGFGVPRPKPLKPEDVKNGIKSHITDGYKFFLDMGSLAHFKERYMGDSVQFWSDMMAHPNYDAFWKARNIRPRLKNIGPATLEVGGLFDAEDLFGAQHVYEALEKQNPQSHKNILVMGPWSHGSWESGSGESLGDQNFGTGVSDWYRENILLPFFNYYLKDKGTMDLPEAAIFITGANQWKKFDTWPPKNTVEKTLYLHANGKLSFDAPTAAGAFDEYVSDPAAPVPYQNGVQAGRSATYMLDDQRFAERRPDVKTYQTDALTEDITLTGPVIADLFASTTGTDADFVVKLIDVFPDDYPNPRPNPKNLIMGGYEMMVRGDIFRGRYRNSFEKPEPFVPGKAAEIKYTLNDIAHTFKKGHRIMVQVQSSWFPLVDRNPQKFVDIYKAKDSDFQKATIRIYHTAQKRSGIKVTVLQ